MRLTLRTLLAYIDDTLPPDEARAIGEKVAENEAARDLIAKIRKVTRKRGLTVPSATGESASYSDPNLVAEYLSDNLPGEKLAEFESLCLDSDVHLAEVAGCHQILTLLLSAPIRVSPTTFRRMYALVDGPESLHTRPPGPVVPVGGVRPDEDKPDDPDAERAYLMGLKDAGESPNARWLRWGLAILLVIGLAVAVALTWINATPADAVK